MSEAEAVVGNYAPLRACAERGGKSAPQFDAAHRIMKEHDGRLALIRGRSPDTGEDAAVGMINPNVVGHAARLEVQGHWMDLWLALLNGMGD